MSPFIYLDNAATTAVRPEVLSKMLPFFTEKAGNPSSIHSAGRETRKAVENARRQVAAVLHAEAREIYFTAGGSESDNWAIRCAAAGEKQRNQAQKISLQQQLIARRGGVVQGIHIVEQVI